MQSSLLSDVDTEGSRPSLRRGRNGSGRHPAVLLINLGTPDGADVASVRRYLAEFLSDPEVITLPSGLGWLNGALGRLIARFRAPSSAEMYQRIWTDEGSPLLRITKEQSAALGDALPDGWRVFHAMRYGRPSIGETLAEIEAAGVDDLTVIPMYPHFSGASTRTALTAMYKHFQSGNHPIQLTTRPTWYDDAGYIHAQSACIKDLADREQLTPDNCFLLFSAHGLPVCYVTRGDPYPEHIRRSIELVTEHLGWPTERFSLSYQSRLGPVAWLEPFTDHRLAELVAAGEKRVLICPISFTADCLETLEEIDMRYREEFEALGGTLFLCPALNTSTAFITALKDLVLRGPQKVVSWSGDARPLMAPPTESAASDARIDSLVMVGASRGNRIGAAPGPELVHSSPDGLRQVKRSQCDVPDLLRKVRHGAGLREAWLWNTCRRFELYGWVEDPDQPEAVDETVARTRRALFGADEPDGLEVNVLRGVDAWHHLLRTATGLNSGLPGEREIVEQLDAAHRLARCAGPAGPLTNRLLTDALAIERDVRSNTKWGSFAPNYCFAALSHVAEASGLDFSKCQVVVIGGSTTSAAVLRTLIDSFKTPDRQLTLLYRGHKRGGQLKLLRKAIGGGHRIRVQSYTEPAVTDAIADADVVVFGIDSEHPVVTGDRIAACRELTARPLTIIDFNMFGSTIGVDSLNSVRLYTAAALEKHVAVYADKMCSTDKFLRAVEEAERYIDRRVDEVRSRQRDDQRAHLRIAGAEAAASGRIAS